MVHVVGLVVVAVVRVVEEAGEVNVDRERARVKRMAVMVIDGWMDGRKGAGGVDGVCS